MFYYFGLVLAGILLNVLVNTRITALAVVVLTVMAPVVWAGLIAWDVWELREHLDGWLDRLYPLLAVFLSGFGVLLYLWDRERNIPDAD